MKDVRGVAGTRSNGRKDGMTDGHTRKDEGHFCSSRPPTSGDKNRKCVKTMFFDVRSTSRYHSSKHQDLRLVVLGLTAL